MCLTSHGGGRYDAESETLIPTTGGGFDVAPTLSSSGAGTARTGNSRTEADFLVAFSAKDHGADAMQDCSPTLRAGGHSSSHANAGVMPAVAYGADCFNGSMTGEVAATMGTRGSSETASGPTLLQAMQVRRLMPEECEALQGFPHSYTAIPYRGKRAADGPRYKALGNSWAVPCAKWIGERIAEVESLTEPVAGRKHRRPGTNKKNSAPESTAPEPALSMTEEPKG